MSQIGSFPQILVGMKIKIFETTTQQNILPVGRPVTQEVSSQQPPWVVRNRSNPRRLACVEAPRRMTSLDMEFITGGGGETRPQFFVLVVVCWKIWMVLDVPIARLSRFLLEDNQVEQKYNLNW